jgi:Arc/MetJ family transcription regulator
LVALGCWSCRTVVSIDVDAELCHGALVHVAL